MGGPDGTGRAGGGAVSVLIVDDTAEIRELLRMTLARDVRFEAVGEAGDGHEAVIEAARLQPDVVLLDLAMPVLDGLEALPDILAVSPASKVLVLSAFSSSQMADESLQRGASAYMEKSRIAQTLGSRLRELYPDDPDAPRPAPSTRTIVTGTALAPRVDMTVDEVVSLLVHELQNPVSVVSGFASMLETSAESMSPEMIQRSAAAVSRGARHLAGLVQSFGDLRRLESGTMTLSTERFDLGGLVRDCVADMDGTHDEHPMTLRVPDGVVVDADPMRIRQVLINLLSNAAKFSPRDAAIEIDLRSGGGAVELSVRDHGPGIPADRAPELFGKFSRLGAMARGTGIGLFISRAIAVAHHGALELASSDHSGTRFVLRLPPAASTGAA